MSVVSATTGLMDETLDRLVTLAADSTTLGALDFLDHVQSTAAAMCMRPGDVDRVAWALYQLATEVAYLRSGRQVDA